MLSYILAIAVGLGSLSLYLATFFVPHVHRKDDLILSGLGLFYALVLWTCAGRITGGVLLGQVAGVTLLGWFMWETVSLRGIIAKPDEQTVISATTQAKINELSFSKLFDQITNKFSKKPLVISAPTPSITVETDTDTENNNEVAEISPIETLAETEATPTPETVTETETTQEVPQNFNFVQETSAETVIQEETVTTQALEKTEAISPVEVKTSGKKGFSFGNLITGIFGKKKEPVETTTVVSEEETTEQDQELMIDETETERTELDLEESAVEQLATTVIQAEETEEITTLDATTETANLETETIDEPEITADMVTQTTETVEGELEETPTVIEENTQNQLTETEDIITIEASSLEETELTQTQPIETEPKKSADSPS